MHCHIILQPPAPEVRQGEAEVQVAVVGSGDSGGGGTIPELLQADPQYWDTQSVLAKQQHDSELARTISYHEKKELPSDPDHARHIVLQRSAPIQSWC